jgi:hypothetical protein
MALPPRVLLRPKAHGAKLAQSVLCSGRLGRPAGRLCEIYRSAVRETDASHPALSAADASQEVSSKRSRFDLPLFANRQVSIRCLESFIWKIGA